MDLTECSDGLFASFGNGETVKVYNDGTWYWDSKSRCEYLSGFYDESGAIWVECPKYDMPFDPFPARIEEKVRMAVEEKLRHDDQ